MGFQSYGLRQVRLYGISLKIKIKNGGMASTDTAQDL
jgi:hypothetical protein